MKNINNDNNRAENRTGNINGMQWYRLYGSGKSIPLWNQIFNKFVIDHRYCKTKNGIMYIINCSPEIKDQIMEELSDTIGKCIKLDDDRVKRFNEIIDSVDVIKERKRGI